MDHQKSALLSFIKGRILVSLLTLVALGTCALVGVFTWLYPWFRMPERSQEAIAADWQKLEVAAELPKALGDDRRLLKTLALISDF